VVEDSDASKEGHETKEEDDEEAPFITRRQRAAADELIDTVESSPSGQNDDEAIRIPLAMAAPETSTAPPPKKPLGFFVDEDGLLSGS
jgi:hypothetical protein